MLLQKYEKYDEWLHYCCEKLLLLAGSVVEYHCEKNKKKILSLCPEKQNILKIFFLGSLNTNKPENKFFALQNCKIISKRENSIPRCIYLDACKFFVLFSRDKMGI